MTALLILLAALAYLAVAMATMRVLALWQSRGDCGPYGPDPLFDLIFGLVWPLTVVIFLVLGTIAGMYALATRGIDKEGT